MSLDHQGAQIPTEVAVHIIRGFVSSVSVDGNAIPLRIEIFSCAVDDNDEDKPEIPFDNLDDVYDLWGLATVNLEGWAFNSTFRPGCPLSRRLGDTVTVSLDNCRIPHAGDNFKSSKEGSHPLLLSISGSTKLVFSDARKLLKIGVVSCVHYPKLILADQEECKQLLDVLATVPPGSVKIDDITTRQIVMAQESVLEFPKDDAKKRMLMLLKQEMATSLAPYIHSSVVDAKFHPGDSGPDASGPIDHGNIRLCALCKGHILGGGYCTAMYNGVHCGGAAQAPEIPLGWDGTSLAALYETRTTQTSITKTSKELTEAESIAKTGTESIAKPTEMESFENAGTELIAKSIVLRIHQNGVPTAVKAFENLGPDSMAVMDNLLLGSKDGVLFYCSFLPSDSEEEYCSSDSDAASSQKKSYFTSFFASSVFRPSNKKNTLEAAANQEIAEKVDYHEERKVVSLPLVGAEKIKSLAAFGNRGICCTDQGRSFLLHLRQKAASVGAEFFECHGLSPSHVGIGETFFVLASEGGGMMTVFGKYCLASSSVLILVNW